MQEVNVYKEIKPEKMQDFSGFVCYFLIGFPTVGEIFFQ